jgi:hypothetical protein
MTTAILDRQRELDEQVLGAIDRRVREIRDAWEKLPAWQRGGRQLEGSDFFGIDSGWVPCRMSLFLPTADRTTRQRAGDAIRRLAAAGRVELTYNPSGRLGYVRLSPNGDSASG